MSKKDIFETMGFLDDDLIAEAKMHPRKRGLQVRKSFLIAAVAAVLFSITVLAGNIILVSRSSFSSNIPTYETVPSAETLRKDIGIFVHIKNEYDNGYTYQSGYILENEDFFNNYEAKTYKGLACTYEKDQKTLDLYVEPESAGVETTDTEGIISYKGCELIYYSYTMKTLPGDYELTEQDLKDKQSGKYVFSFGDSVTRIADIQGIIWTQNGIDFQILDDSQAASKEELIRMAEETIDGQ